MELALDLPQEWQRAAEGVEAEGGIALILGASSAGKTTLLKYLVGRLGHRGQRVGVVDADIGQSTLGPPATISGVVFDPHSQPIETVEPQELFFVGSTSPAGYLLQTVVGTKKLVEWVESSGASFTLVDTTGMVQGAVASQLKFHKIDLLRPRHLLVLQRSGELESLVRPFVDRKTLRIYRLPVSPMARSRNPQERKAYREKKFRGYFKGASVELLSISRLAFLHQTASHFTRSKGGFPRYLLVGLNDAENRTLALGIVEAFDRESQELFIYTPLRDLTPLRYLVLGSLRVDPNGRELVWDP